LGWRTEGEKLIRKGKESREKTRRKETHRASTAKYEEREREKGPSRRW
jgi:hypothetical protein